jgi:hypothetical protein
MPDPERIMQAKDAAANPQPKYNDGQDHWYRSRGPNGFENH